MPDAFHLWTNARSRRIACAVLISFALALVLTFVNDAALTSSLLRGDFPAFYAAAQLVWSGQGRELYVPALQAAIENSNWPSLGGSYLAFVYPPYFALLLSPLALLGPIAAKICFTLINFVALNVALYFSSKVFPLIARNYFLSFVLCLSFGPVFSGLVGGQNVAISLMLYALTVYLIGLNSARAEILAGICVGLLFFKPHFAALFLVVALLARSYRLVAGALSVLGIYYLCGSYVMGPDWPQVWLAAVKEFSVLDFEVNGYQMVSLHAVALKLTEDFAFSADTQRLLNYGTLILCVLILVPVLYFSLLAGKTKAKDPSRYRQDLRMIFVVLGPCVVLCSIHTLYYDLGLCLFAFVVALRMERERHMHLMVAVWLLIFALTICREHFSWQPMIVFALWAYLRAIRLLRTGAIPEPFLPEKNL